ncbi:uncharacterized protein [Penaeus vannamei]|uniref:uncharacterized protein n=1 Tax=Penaeus vannamei TaxID=6689 RepID=UPI00387F4BDD
MPGRKSRDLLTIISANVRGLLTKIGDLVNSHVIPRTPDIVATVETFMNESVPDNFGHMKGYTRWNRRDRTHGSFGGVAVSFHKSLSVQPLDVVLPSHLEIMFFKIWAQHQTVLLCVCYRPQWQGREPIVFLQTHLDELLQLHTCNHVVIVGDMNQHLVARSFEELLTVHGLFNHVDFPTHISGSSLDPVVSDLPDSVVTCSPLSAVGSSDHMAVLTLIQVTPQRDAAVTRTNWLWGKADWKGLCNALQQTPWNSILIGEVNNQGHTFTHTAQAPRTTRPLPLLHCQAPRPALPCDKFSNGLNDAGKILKPNSGVVQCVARPGRPHSSSIKARHQIMMYHHYKSLMMSVPDPERPIPYVPVLTNASTSTITITTEDVRQRLSQVDTNKALGPDNISPHILKRCASQLATPLTTIFQQCIITGVWPTLWKGARVVAIHKKGKRTDPINYRSISLLSVLGKVLEAIIADKISCFLTSHHLLNNKQFGFRINRSAADLLLQLSTAWQKSLDQGKDTFIIALDIAGAFGRVWHRGLITKLNSLGIRGHLLHLLQDYLQSRFLRVVMNGQTSDEHSIHASVPQDAYAYADDCTLTFPCDSSDHRATVAHINQVLQTIVVWGRRWQVDLAPEKTQVMLVSRRHSPLDTPIPTILLDGRALPLQASISILGVEMNSALTFTGHVKNIGKPPGNLIVSGGYHFLISRESPPYMQVKSAPSLTWSSSPPSYLGLLDKIQQRAQRLICLKAPPDQSSPLMQPLQQRRDVAGLCVIYKTHKQSAPHLTALRQPWAQPHGHATRAAATGDDQLVVPFARTETFLRSFLPRYTRMWNHLVQQTQLHRTTSLHTFKSAVNAWIKQP